uniref:G-protein coupled receptors family 1 profile domain-containing protein n=1 Tax=Panagrolaimus sp. PS1159 TaxID=55785 RepID=A0AC35FUZ1_9BILA
MRTNRTSLSNNTTNSNPAGMNNCDSIKRKQMFPFMEGIMNSRINKKHRRCNWLRVCSGKSEYSNSEDSTDVPNNPDETSLASSVYATSLKRSVKASSTMSNQENADPETASLDAAIEQTSPRSRTLTDSNRFRSRNASERPLLHNYTVLIELRDGEGKRPSVRLSSVDKANLRPTSGETGPRTPMRKRSRSETGPRTPMRKRSRSDVAATADDIKRVSMAAGVGGGENRASTKIKGGGNGTIPETLEQHPPHQNGKAKGIDKTDARKSEKERRKNERKQDSKAAKTLSAILIAFIITWTPYNVIVVWEAFFPKTVPNVLFTISYCLCYINSTINPVCYALCNARFRNTYMRILRCRWKQDRTANGLYRNAYLRRA